MRKSKPSKKGRKPSKQWVVYVLLCRDGTLYTGITNDLKARLVAHNAKKGAKYTRSRGPVKLLHFERKRNKSNALKREYAIKQLSRKEKWALAEASRS